MEEKAFILIIADVNSSYCVESFDLLKADGALKLYVFVDHRYHSLDITARCIPSDWLSSQSSK